MNKEEFNAFRDNEQVLKKFLETLDKEDIINLYLQKNYDFTLMHQHYIWLVKEKNKEISKLRGVK